MLTNQLLQLLLRHRDRIEFLLPAFALLLKMRNFLLSTRDLRTTFIISFLHAILFIVGFLQFQTNFFNASFQFTLCCAFFFNYCVLFIYACLLCATFIF